MYIILRPASFKLALTCQHTYYTVHKVP